MDKWFYLDDTGKIHPIEGVHTDAVSAIDSLESNDVGNACYVASYKELVSWYEQIRGIIFPESCEFDKEDDDR